MALIKCKECSKEISDECKNCPNCGVKTEKTKLKSKKIKFYASILIAIVLILTISVIFLLKPTKANKTESIDGSKLNKDELYELFKEEGYSIRITTYSDTPSTTYVVLENKTEGITVQRIYNKYVGNLMTFDDDSVNDEMADLLYPDKNETEKEKQQYKVYQSWLKNYNITKTQLTEMIDNYYNKNLDKIEIIDISELLSN